MRPYPTEKSKSVLRTEKTFAYNANLLHWRTLAKEKGNPITLKKVKIKERQRVIYIAISETTKSLNERYPDLGLIGAVIFGSYAYDNRAHERSDVNALLIFNNDAKAIEERRAEFLTSFNDCMDLMVESAPHMLGISTASRGSLRREVNDCYPQYYGANLTVLTQDNEGLRRDITEAFEEMETFAEIRHVGI